MEINDVTKHILGQARQIILQVQSLESNIYHEPISSTSLLEASA